jgi:hypothetical protein
MDGKKKRFCLVNRRLDVCEGVVFHKRIMGGGVFKSYGAVLDGGWLVVSGMW